MPPSDRPTKLMRVASTLAGPAGSEPGAAAATVSPGIDFVELYQVRFAPGAGCRAP